MNDMDNMKEMVGPAMRLMNELTKDIKSENAMSEFIEHNIGSFFTTESEMAGGFLIKCMMDDANRNPRTTLEKFLKFYNNFREFYTGLQNGEEADKNPPVREKDDSTTKDTDQE